MYEAKHMGMTKQRKKKVKKQGEEGGQKKKFGECWKTLEQKTK